MSACSTGISGGASSVSAREYSTKYGAEVHHVTRNYDVVFVDGEVPKHSLRRYASVAIDGSSERSGYFTGWTKWHISWSFVPRKTKDGCMAAAAKVHLKIDMILPLFVFQIRNSEFIDFAKNYMSQLYGHEAQHAAIAVDYANYMQSELDSARSADCKGFSGRVNAVMRGLLSDLRLAQRQFDLETSHGRMHCDELQSVFCL